LYGHSGKASEPSPAPCLLAAGQLGYLHPRGLVVRGLVVRGLRGGVDDTDRAVRILGPLEVFNGQGYQWIGAAKRRALLAALVIHCGRTVSIDQISAELWGGSPPRGAINLIHGYVMRLRRALGDPDARLLVTRSPGYQLAVSPTEIDAGRFGLLAADGLAALRVGDPTSASAKLTEALALWRGPALADVPATPLVQAEAARLEELRLTVLEARVDADLALGRHPGLIVELQALTRDHPLRERLWSQLMLALYRSGRRADALAAYQQVHAVLRDELGIDPTPTLSRLHHQILTTDAVLDRPAATAPVRQLPARSVVFTGRTAELDRLCERLWEPAISTIDGMAGVGKTSLAVHAAHRLAPRFGDGQLFLDLHGFTEHAAPISPGDALNRLLRAIGVPGHELPDGVDDRAALLRGRLAGRRMLIVLDNAANEAQVRPLLPGALGCRVLITSRRRLTGLDDAYPISLDVLPEPDAVELFTRIAGQHEPTSQVAEIVDLCGRLPLAVRIAAARLRARPTWPLAHLAERLRDRAHRLAELDDGERSAAAAFRVSYDRLTAAPQGLFRLLGRHSAADIDVPRAAALTGAGPEQAGRLLEDLVDAHLLGQPAPGRYRFPALLADYAATLTSNPRE
jgi:DNA-binding SARP family transcriptional activator